MKIAWGKVIRVSLIVIPVLVLLWCLSIWIFGWPYSYPAIRLFGFEGLEIVRESRETEAYNVQASSADIDKSNNRQETSGTINGFPILKGPVRLDGQSTSELRSILLRRKLYDVKTTEAEEKKGPFIPEYALRWRSRDRTISILVCRSCNEVETVMHESKGRTLWQRRRSVVDLSQVETVLRKAFPK